MIPIVLPLSWLLAASLFAQDACPGPVNLLSQFADAERDQGQVGACQTFASIGLVEAALARRFPQRRFSLSEGDVFLRARILQDVRNKGAVSEETLRDTDQLSFCGPVSEGSNPWKITRFILDNGAATSQLVPYERFQNGYCALRKRLWVAHALGEETRLSRGDLHDALTGIVTTRELPDGALAFDVPAELLGGRTPEEYRRERREVLEQSRSTVRAALAPFELKTLAKRDLLNIGFYSDPAACRADGRLVEQIIERTLCSGQPVGVSMDVSGLQAWANAAPPGTASHAFLIVGFQRQEGVLVFRTRNSWTGQHPDIREDELCRVFQVLAVMPGSRAWDGDRDPAPFAAPLPPGTSLAADPRARRLATQFLQRYWTDAAKNLSITGHFETKDILLRHEELKARLTSMIGRDGGWLALLDDAQKTVLAGKALPLVLDARLGGTLPRTRHGTRLALESADRRISLLLAGGKDEPSYEEQLDDYNSKVAALKQEKENLAQQRNRSLLAELKGICRLRARKLAWEIKEDRLKRQAFERQWTDPRVAAVQYYGEKPARSMVQEVGRLLDAGPLERLSAQEQAALARSEKKERAILDYYDQRYQAVYAALIDVDD